MTSYEKPSFFAILPAYIRHDKKISSSAKLLYAELTALTNPKGFCTISNAPLAQFYGFSPSTIKKLMLELKKHNYIEVVYDNKCRKIYPIQGGE